jgi:hypothetical protein
LNNHESNIMKDPEKIAFKGRLKQWALDLIGQRITASREAIDEAQQSANSEEKSSAGDKYETGRAMGHLQKDMHSRQLAESIKELATLHAINTDLLYAAAAAGAFIRTETVAFFIAAGLGKQQTEGQTIFFLSPLAPLAKQLQNKKTGDRFLFNGATIAITEIF